MSDTQHTPGPWTCRRVSVWAFAENGTSDKSRIVANTQTAYPDNADAANAQLVAAAPDLLSVLKRLVTYIDNEGPAAKEWEAITDLCEQAHAIIAKAKGGVT